MKRRPDHRWRLLWPAREGEAGLWVQWTQGDRSPRTIRWLEPLERGQRPYLALDGLTYLAGPGGLVDRADATATTLEPPEIQGWKVRRNRHEATSIRPCGSWDLSHDPEEAVLEAEALHEQIAGIGLSAAKSPASVAVSLACSRIRRGALAPRYREISRAAVCPGPTLVCQGGGEAVEQWDLRAAFLESLRGPVPIRESWRPATGRPWEGLTGRPGLATVALWMPPAGELARDVHPCPVWYNGQRVYATGHLVGTWTIAAIDWAVEKLGAEVIGVHDAALCVEKDAGIAEIIDELPDPLRRLVYTRLWGRALCLGGWEELGREEDGEVTWGWRGGERLGDAGDPFHRPDLAAWVTGRASIALSELACQLLPGELVAAHVDALWLEWSPARRALPSVDWSRWKRKAGPAPGTWRGIGTYEHAGEVARQGIPWWSKDRLAPVRVHRNALEIHARDWGAPLSSGRNAWSRQRHLSSYFETQILAPASDVALWDERGYPLKVEWREQAIPARIVRAGEGPAYIGQVE